MDTPGHIFSKIQDFTSILSNISLNVPSSKAVLSKNSQSKHDKSLNFSMGLLSEYAMMDNSITSMYRVNYPSSFDRYLRPAQSHGGIASQSKPMSGDDAENVYPQSLNVQKPVDTPSTPFLVPSVPPATYRQVHSSTSSALGLSGRLPWDNIVIGSTSEDISSDLKGENMLKFRLIEDDCESEQAEVILFKNVDEWNAAIALMKYEDPNLFRNKKWQDSACPLKFGSGDYSSGEVDSGALGFEFQTFTQESKSPGYHPGAVYKIGEKHICSKFNRMTCPHPDAHNRLSKKTGEMVTQHHVCTYVLHCSGGLCGGKRHSSKTHLCWPAHCFVCYMATYVN